MSYKSIGLFIVGDAITVGSRIAEIPSRTPKINAIGNNLFIIVHPAQVKKFAYPPINS
jgi:hypothetical protein